MVGWLIRKTFSQLCGFLRLTGYHRKFMKNCASSTYPLTELLKKDAFILFEEAQQSFVLFKRALSKPLFVQYLIFRNPSSYKQTLLELKLVPYYLKRVILVLTIARKFPTTSKFFNICTRIICHYL